MTPTDHPRAALLAVQLPDVSEADQQSSLEELSRLATTLGLEVIARVTQRRTALAAAAVVGAGKLRDLASWTGGTGIVPSGAPAKKHHGWQDEDQGEEPAEPAPALPASERATIVLVDHDITPSQARNLERATGAEVLDRTAVILEIFHRHAHTREARLQVEMARLAYMAPRMRDSGKSKERQRGGIHGKGAGESAMELDRRKIRDRIAELREELAAIERESQTRRRRRRFEAPVVALVGYTNAGKSSLMRALTGSDVLVADKLFATLDTTVRALCPETRPRILVSDTVGFIKRLPHDLVASFRSTLEEAREADLLLHVVDAADPAFAAQIAVTREVLAEIGAGEAPSLLVLNKADLLPEDERSALGAAHPGSLVVSAREPADVAALHARIVAFFEQAMVEAELFVPYAEQRRVAEIHERCRVLEERHDQDGTHLRVRSRPEVLASFGRP